MEIAEPPLPRRLFAESIGTIFLLIGVVGSGVMAQRLSPNDVGLQLLQNALVTAAVLAALILALRPISGAHFNPVVTLAEHVFSGRHWRETLAYILVQIPSAIVGVLIANAMFEVPVAWSTTERFGQHLWLGEVVATFGLILVIFSVVRSGNAQHCAAVVATYIGGAYYFTSSTSFANPAVTIGRMFSDTFAGIQPSSAPYFVVAQIFGLILGVVAIYKLYPNGDG